MQNLPTLIGKGSTKLYKIGGDKSPRPQSPKRSVGPGKGHFFKHQPMNPLRVSMKIAKLVFQYYLQVKKKVRGEWYSGL